MPAIIKPLPSASLNRDHPLADQLIACWPMNEGSGTNLHDYSGLHRHGTLVNFASDLPLTGNWDPQAYGYGLFFIRASSNYVSTLASTSNLTAFTVAMLVTDPSAVPIANEIINCSAASSDNLEIYCNTAGRIEFYVYSGASFPFRTSAAIVADGTATPRSLICVFDGVAGLLDIYVDGQLSNGALTGSVPAATNNDSSVMYMGAYKGASSFMNGYLHTVMLYSRAFNANDVANWNSFPFAMFDEPMYQSWPGAVVPMLPRQTFVRQAVNRAASY